jgi:hypothetical protein
VRDFHMIPEPSQVLLIALACFPMVTRRKQREAK